MRPRAPFAERGGRARGVVDLATGCYPAFLFGGSVGPQVPVFHFHDESRESLEPKLRYLVDNGYHTIDCDTLAAFVVEGRRADPRAVMLTFDDAWASMWTVAYPLLRVYGLRAVVFAIPGRLGDTAGAFVTWEQLRGMHASGVVDVQSHTRWHLMMFSGWRIAGFVTPTYAREPLLNRPVVSAGGDDPPRFLEPAALGAPLYVRRSRMSDGRRFIPDGGSEERCRAVVERGGGPEFFRRPDWRRTLDRAAGTPRGREESDDAREAAIRDELVDGRESLDAQLGTGAVRHVALPWGIAGSLTRRLIAEAGYVTAFAERPLRRRAVRAGDDRYGLMRLNGKFVTCLPGTGRRWFLSTVSAT
jgi:hypothetical protein